MSCKFVVGTGAALDWAVAAWREVAPDLEIRPLLLEPDANGGFNLALLDALDASDDATAFVAGDEQFLNLPRAGLMGTLKSKGFAMPALICRGAIISNTATIGQNTFIGAGAIIGQGCQIGFNAVIGAGANLGSGSQIGNSAWIGAGVVIGRSAKIAANVTLGTGVIVGDAIEIGKFCIIDKPGKISANVTAKTFIHASYANPMFIVGK